MNVLGLLCRSEACAVLVMSSTWGEDQPVCAVMRGSAVNQDGRASSLTAPNGPSQAAVIRRALDKALMEPSAVHSLHLHGTGTSLVSCRVFHAHKHFHTCSGWC